MAMPLNTLFLLMGFSLQTLMGVESTKDILVQLPKQQVFKKSVIGKRTLWLSSTNQFRDTVFGK